MNSSVPNYDHYYYTHWMILWIIITKTDAALWKPYNYIMINLYALYSVTPPIPLCTLLFPSFISFPSCFPRGICIEEGGAGGLDGKIIPDQTWQFWTRNIVIVLNLWCMNSRVGHVEGLDPRISTRGEGGRSLAGSALQAIPRGSKNINTRREGCTVILFFYTATNVHFITDKFCD